MRPVTRPRPPTLQPVGMSTGEDLRKYWDNLQKKQEGLKLKCEKTGKDYLTELQRLRTAQEEKLIQDEYKLDCKTRDSIIAGNIKGASHRTEPPQSHRKAPVSLATPLCAGKNVMVPTAAFQNVNHAEKFFEGKIDRSVDRNANTWVRFVTTSKSKKTKKDEHWWSTYQVPHPPQPPILCPALPCSSHASHASHASHTYKWPSRHAPDWPFTVHMPGALSGLEGALSALGPAALPCPSVTGAAPTRTPQPRLSRIASPGGQVA